MRDNPDIHVLSHKWLYECKEKKSRVDKAGYEIINKPSGSANTKKGSRTAFTPEDDVKLVKFLARYAKKRAFLSHLIYEDVEKAYPHHTAMSWRQRFKTNQARLEHEIKRYEGIVQGRRNAQEEPYSDEGDDNEDSLPQIPHGREKAMSSAHAHAVSKPASQSLFDGNMQSNRARAPLTLAPSKKSQQRIGDKATPASETASTQLFRIDLDRPGQRISFSDDEDSAVYETAPESRPSGVSADPMQSRAANIPAVHQQSPFTTQDPPLKRRKLAEKETARSPSTSETAARNLSNQLLTSSAGLPRSLHGTVQSRTANQTVKRKTGLSSMPLPASLFDEVKEGIV